MELTRKTISGLEQRVFPYEPPLTEREVKFAFPQLQDPEELLSEHARKYSEAISIPHWRETILAFPAPLHELPQEDPFTLEPIVTTSYHVQALRKGIAKDITPITVLGLLSTKDNNFVYGIRGGIVGQGQANAVPGGHVTPITQNDANPIFSSYYEELLTETGLTEQEVRDSFLIGHQTDPQHKTLCFVTHSKTPHTSDSLRAKHRQAYTIYQNALHAGKTELDARKAIVEAGLPNTDAWENRELIFVESQPDNLDKIIETGQITHNSHPYKTFDNSIGALMLYRAVKHN